MSSKTRTHRTRTTNAGKTSSARTLRSVPEQASESTGARAARTAAEDKLWVALHASPHSTTGELSAAAGIGQSTAGKILALWAGEGGVTRTAGVADTGRRAAARWSIAESDAPQGTDLPEATDSAETGSAGTDSEPTDVESTADTAPEPTEAPANVDSASASGGRRKAPRLAPGVLRGLVEDYLREHPGEEFSPSKIGKALDRSSGAVSNALERLVADGYAVKTTDAPKRFALASTEQASGPDGPAN